MEINKNEMRIAIDIDDTLIIYPRDRFLTEEGLVTLGYIQFSDCYTNEKFFARPAKKHIKLIKDHFQRGYEVTVWSAAGWQHAKSIVEQLGLEPWVHKIETKFTKYVDDLPANEFMGTRLYIEDLDEKESNV
jgi:phosphoglycolate phosphatase-like HAD superfamily hydrolase